MTNSRNNQNNDRLPEILIFLHIPKAAGSTFYHILSRHYTPETTYIIEGTGRIDSLTHLGEKTRQQKDHFRFVSGHMPFGIHTMLPRSSGYITMLRHPVDRLLSLYYFIQHQPQHYLHDKVIREGMSLTDLLAGGMSSELTNAQTRLLAGEAYDSTTPCSDSMYKQAIANIQSHFLFTGLTERFDESLLILSDTWHWQGLPFYVRQNVNTQRPVQKTLDNNFLTTVREHNGYDLQLYQTIQQSFDEHVSNQGPAFQKRLQRFQALNHILQPFTRASWLWQNISRRNNSPSMS